MSNFIELTILSNDGLDGKPLLVRAEDIRRVTEIEMKDSNDLIIGTDKMVVGAVVTFPDGRIQVVRQSIKEIKELVDEQ